MKMDEGIRFSPEEKGEILGRNFAKMNRTPNRTTRRTSLVVPWLILGLVLVGLVILFTIPGSSQEASAPGTVIQAGPATATFAPLESRDISENSALKLENLQLRFRNLALQQQAMNQAVEAARAAIQVAVEALWTELKIEEKDRGNWNVDLAGRKATKKVVVKE